jgi:hypothetical protein
VSEQEERATDPWGAYVPLERLVWLPWRTGTRALVTVYARDPQTGWERPFLMAPTPQIAEHIVAVHNAALEAAERAAQDAQG